MKKLNLGCCTDIRDEFDNLDIVKFKGVDIVWNLNKFPYPIKDNTYDEIHAICVLEHLDDMEKCLREWHRILKKDGKLIIKVPYDISYACWTGWQHKRGFNLRTFTPFAENTKVNEYGIDFIFADLQQRLWFPKGLHLESYIIEPLFNSCKLMQRIYEETGLRALFPAHSVIAELKK